MQPVSTGNPRVFTTYSTGLRNSLKNEVGIAAASTANPPIQQTSTNFSAVWDIGATNTVITANVVAQCGLKQSGVARVSNTERTYTTPTYIVDVYLPNVTVVPAVTVSLGNLPGNDDILIGMDIIGAGDFAVTNFEGKTVFTFRMPPMGLIDFRVDANYATPGASLPAALTGVPPAPIASAPDGALPPSKNAKCPCGSNKKYKRCHGK